MYRLKQTTADTDDGLSSDHLFCLSSSQGTHVSLTYIRRPFAYLLTYLGLLPIYLLTWAFCLLTYFGLLPSYIGLRTTYILRPFAYLVRPFANVLT